MTSAILFKKRYIKFIIIFLSLIVVFFLGPLLLYNIAYMGSVYPNISVAGVDIGGKLPNEAILFLSQNVSPPSKINLVGQSQSFELKTEDIGLNYDFSASVERAYNLTRTENIFFDTIKRIQLLNSKENLGLITNIDNSKLTDFLSFIAGQVDINPIYPSFENKEGSVLINNGITGSKIDSINLRAAIGQTLSYAESKDIIIPLTILDPTLNEQQITTAKLRGQKYIGKNITLNFDSQKFVYNESDILKFLKPSGGFNDDLINDVISKIAADINRDPQNPKFEFNGTKVTEFLPALDGISLDKQKMKDLLTTNLESLSESTEKNIAISVLVTRTPPSVTTDKVNNLGINQMIGKGNSTYFHSIPGRIFNVNLAASKINGTIVKPGEVFSFNQVLGDVSKLTGYKEAYIISEGKTMLGDGGGVCQVSTTLFRAVLNAGLPIIERAAHAYRVGYYEQGSPPGLDATVYSPSPDFKFKNDTPGHILIQAKNNPKNYSLVFEIYGTHDGRVATISKPTISNNTPALPTVYQDDPTLPIGTSKQIDYAAAGARVSFNYSVVRGGEQIFKKTFVSNYQPWAAVYLKGTGPAN